MDSELVLLILLAIGFFWFFNYNGGVMSRPIPGIGNNSGAALVGSSNVVSQEAAKTGSYFKTSNIGGTGGPSTSTPAKAENYILPITDLTTSVKPYFYKKSSPAFQKTCIRKGC